MNSRRIVVPCLLTIALLTHPSSAQVSPDDLVAWWELDDTSDSAPGGARPLTLLDGATLVDVGGDGALALDPDPSNNRAVTTAFNPTDSFSVIIDFQADTIPSGSVDPQYVLLSNVGDDSQRFFSQFGNNPGYQVFIGPNSVRTFQKTSGGFTGSTGTGLGLPDPTGRHTVVVNWESSGGLYRATLFLDGSGSSATSAFGPMDFTSGATTDLLLGTNVDEAFQPPRTLDGMIFEAALFDGLLSPEQIDIVASQGVGALVPEPSSLAVLAFMGIAVLLRRP